MGYTTGTSNFKQEKQDRAATNVYTPNINDSENWKKWLYFIVSLVMWLSFLMTCLWPPRSMEKVRNSYYVSADILIYQQWTMSKISRWLCIVLRTMEIRNQVRILALLTKGVLGTQDLFFAHFTTFASFFFHRYFFWLKRDNFFWNVISVI